MNAFRNRIALVTGAGSGIGRALSGELARRGARVVVTDVDGDAAERVAGELRAAGHAAESAPLDVTSPADFHAVVDRLVDEHGHVDLLFNNAGVGMGGLSHEMTPGHWRKVLSVNLDGVVHGVQAVYPRMVRQHRGHIVNTASVAGLVPFPQAVAYATTKHAVVGLSTSLAAEASAYGVKVSVACPGFIDTGIFERTTYVGVDMEAARKALPFPPAPVEPTARAIVDGVAKGKVVIPVTRHAWALWLWYRTSPDAMVARLGKEAAARLRKIGLAPR